MPPGPQPGARSRGGPGPSGSSERRQRMGPGDAADREKDELRLEKKNLRQELAAMNLELESVRSTNERLTAGNLDMEDELHDLRDELENEKRGRDDRDSDFKALDKEKKSSDDELRRLRNLDTTCDKLRRDFDQLEMSKNELEDEFANLEEHKEDLLDDIEEKEDEISELTNRVAELTEIKTQFESGQRHLETENAVAKSDNRKCNAQIDKLVAELAVQTQQMQALSDERGEMIDAHEREKVELKAQLSGYILSSADRAGPGPLIEPVPVGDSDDAVARLLEENKLLEDQVEDLHERLAQDGDMGLSHEELSEYDRREEALRARLLEKDNGLHDKQAELTFQKKKVSELTKALSDSDSERKKVRLEVSKYKDMYKTLLEDNNLTSVANSLREEQERNDTSERMIKNLNKRISLLEADRKTDNAAKDNMRLELERNGIMYEPPTKVELQTEVEKEMSQHKALTRAMQEQLDRLTDENREMHRQRYRQLEYDPAKSQIKKPFWLSDPKKYQEVLDFAAAVEDDKVEELRAAWKDNTVESFNQLERDHALVMEQKDELQQSNEVLIKELQRARQDSDHMPAPEPLPPPVVQDSPMVMSLNTHMEQIERMLQEQANRPPSIIMQQPSPVAPIPSSTETSAPLPPQPIQMPQPVQMVPDPVSREALLALESQISDMKAIMQSSQPKIEDLKLIQAQLAESTAELEKQKLANQEQVEKMNKEIGRLLGTIDTERARNIELDASKQELTERIEAIRKTPSVNVVVPEGILGDATAGGGSLDQDTRKNMAIQKYHAVLLQTLDELDKLYDLNDKTTVELVSTKSHLETLRDKQAALYKDYVHARDAWGRDKSKLVGNLEDERANRQAQLKRADKVGQLWDELAKILGGDPLAISQAGSVPADFSGPMYDLAKKVTRDVQRLEVDTVQLRRKLTNMTVEERNKRTMVDILRHNLAKGDQKALDKISGLTRAKMTLENRLNMLTARLKQTVPKDDWQRATRRLTSLTERMTELQIRDQEYIRQNLERNTVNVVNQELRSKLADMTIQAKEAEHRIEVLEKECGHSTKYDGKQRDDDDARLSVDKLRVELDHAQTRLQLEMDLRTSGDEHITKLKSEIKHVQEREASKTQQISKLQESCDKALLQIDGSIPRTEADELKQHLSEAREQLIEFESKCARLHDEAVFSTKLADQLLYNKQEKQSELSSLDELREIMGKSDGNSEIGRLRFDLIHLRVREKDLVRETSELQVLLEMKEESVKKSEQKNDNSQELLIAMQQEYHYSTLQLEKQVTELQGMIKRQMPQDKVDELTRNVESLASQQLQWEKDGVALRKAKEESETLAAARKEELDVQIQTLTTIRDIHKAADDGEEVEERVEVKLAEWGTKMKALRVEVIQRSHELERLQDERDLLKKQTERDSGQLLELRSTLSKQEVDIEERESSLQRRVRHLEREALLSKNEKGLYLNELAKMREDAAANGGNGSLAAQHAGSVNASFETGGGGGGNTSTSQPQVTLQVARQHEYENLPYTLEEVGMYFSPLVAQLLSDQVASSLPEAVAMSDANKHARKSGRAKVVVPLHRPGGAARLMVPPSTGPGGIATPASYENVTVVAIHGNQVSYTVRRLDGFEQVVDESVLMDITGRLQGTRAGMPALGPMVMDPSQQDLFDSAAAKHGEGELSSLHTQLESLRDTVAQLRMENDGLKERAEELSAQRHVQEPGDADEQEHRVKAVGQMTLEGVEKLIKLRDAAIERYKVEIQSLQQQSMADMQAKDDELLRLKKESMLMKNEQDMRAKQNSLLTLDMDAQGDNLAESAVGMDAQGRNFNDMNEMVPMSFVQTMMKEKESKLKERIKHLNAEKSVLEEKIKMLGAEKSSQDSRVDGHQKDKRALNETIRERDDTIRAKESEVTELHEELRQSRLQAPRVRDQQQIRILEEQLKVSQQNMNTKKKEIHNLKLATQKLAKQMEDNALSLVEKEEHSNRDKELQAAVNSRTSKMQEQVDRVMQSMAKLSKDVDAKRAQIAELNVKVQSQSAIIQRQQGLKRQLEDRDKEVRDMEQKLERMALDAEKVHNLHSEPAAAGVTSPTASEGALSSTRSRKLQDQVAQLTVELDLWKSKALVAEQSAAQMGDSSARPTAATASTGTAAAPTSATERWEAGKKMQKIIDALKLKLKDRKEEVDGLVRKEKELREVIKKQEKQLTARGLSSASAGGSGGQPSAVPSLTLNDIRAHHLVLTENQQLNEQVHMLKNVVLGEKESFISKLEEEIRLLRKAAPVLDSDHGNAEVDDYLSLLHENSLLKFDSSQKIWEVEALTRRLGEMEALTTAALQISPASAAQGTKGSDRAATSVGRGPKSGSSYQSSQREADLENVVDKMKKVIKRVQQENDSLRRNAQSNLKYMETVKENRDLKRRVSEMHADQQVTKQKSVALQDVNNQATRLRAENSDIRRALEQVTGEKTLELQALTSELRKREAQLALAHQGGANDQLLQAKDIDILRLQQELERTRENAGGGSDQSVTIMALQAEVNALKSSTGAPSTGPSSTDFEALVAENRDLKKELSAITPEFFAEIMDLKVNYEQAVSKLSAAGLQ